MISRIAHVCLSSTDLDVTERFYCGALGMRRAFDFLRDGSRCGFYLAAGGGSFVEVFRAETCAVEGRHPLRHVCFEVEDIDVLIAHARAAGAVVTDKLLAKDNTWQCWLTDPDGVRIECHQYTAESTQRTGVDCLLDDA